MKLAMQRLVSLAAVSSALASETSAVAGHVKDLPPMYTDADEVARYLEKRRPVEIATEGAKPDVDIPVSEEESMVAAFEETPDVFRHCVLIRDFATPLRVTSALSLGRQARLRGGPRKEVADDSKDDDDDDDDKDDDKDDKADDDDEDTEDEQGLPPDTKLVTKGGVVDRDEAPDGKKDAALMEVTMIAYLQSVAGHVTVIPKGTVAKWSSKKKVPIAGYLCTDTGNPVLHTLPTPCVATALTDDGTEALPPPPAVVPPAAVEEVDPAMGLGGAPAPAAMEMWAPSPSLIQTAKEANAYSVYVGSAKLHFSSKGKAEHFCRRLTEKIAEDPGDNTWDTEKVKGMALGTDVKLSTFVQLTRKDPPQAWTTGTKKVLVIVMDWMPGDSSKAPMSSQTTSPAHYRDTVFPRVKKAFQDMSFGKFDIDYTVIPEVIRYTKPRSRYTSDGFPFPALYNGAVESLAGNARYASKYDPRNYDLVYTVSPQQAPVGTKGVAWVGAKGAMCNGCEAISVNFQVMVAVHELGHNLGLMHAGSSSLEYGNPFDWMGNYPDVQGLSYGMGYKLKLHWLPRSSVMHVTDSSLNGLNDRVILAPFDIAEPGQGQLVGVQLSLNKNKRDLYIAYRKTTGREAGIYVVYQDKSTPDSELIDMGCHTPSQKDARLQPGWTFVDPSSQVVVVVESVAEGAAVLHLYQAPGAAALEAIRARDTYSDGTFKCPRTCTDSDLLVSNFNGCPGLSGKGYCKGGVITMGGRKYSVKDDLCPKSCGECEAVLAGSPLVGGSGGCADRNVKINGMSCPAIAAKGFCDANTNIGNVGRDLCPASCGNCPKKPSFGGSASSFSDPTPARTRGDGASPSPPPPPASTAAPSTDSAGAPDEEPAKPACTDDAEWTDSEGDNCAVYRDFINKGKLSRQQACSYGTGAARKHCRETCGDCGAAAAPACEDEASWKDVDGDSCEVYAQYIRDGQLTRQAACAYQGGGAARHCKKTCNTCPAKISQQIYEEPDYCEDSRCVGDWLRKTGQCFSCSEWPSRCNETSFERDCPRTCGLCDAVASSVKVETEAPPTCEDSECIEAWREAAGGKCLKCSDFAADYCGNDKAFMEACPRSCNLCAKNVPKEPCQDVFKLPTCLGYKSMGWCKHTDIAENCQKTCDACAPKDDYPYTPVEETRKQTQTPAPAERSGAARHALALLAALASLAACAGW